MIVLDTSILVTILRQQPGGALAMERLANESVAITSISAFELLYGARVSARSTKNLEVVKELLEEFPILDFTCTSAVIASAIQLDLARAGMPIELNDVYIAAIVLENDGTLVTLNTGHFSRIKQLNLHHV